MRALMLVSSMTHVANRDGRQKGRRRQLNSMRFALFQTTPAQTDALRNEATSCAQGHEVRDGGLPKPSVETLSRGTDEWQLADDEALNDEAVQRRSDTVR
jgi:hypothetical protein